MVFLLEKRTIEISNDVKDLKTLNELRTPIELSLKAIEVSEEMYQLIDCESKWDSEAIGDLDYDYPAYGLIQIQERTWDWLCRLSDKQLDYYNPRDQIELLKWAMENDFGSLWTCYKRLKIKEEI